MHHRLKQFAKNNWTVVLAVLVFTASLANFAQSRGYLSNLNFVNQWSAAQEEKQLRKTAQALYDYCQDAEHVKAALTKERCYAKQLQPIAAKSGSEQAFDVLHQLQVINPRTFGCHLIAHGIGWGTFQYEPTLWQRDIQTMDASCSGGAIHGVIEAYLATQPERTLTKDNLSSICGPTPRKDCNHIIGHLIMVETKADIPKALNICDAFKDNLPQLHLCYTGVFMENETALNLIEHGLAPKSFMDWSARLPEIEKLCRSYSDQRAIACWREIAHVVLTKVKNDPKLAFDFCSTSQILEGSIQCKQHSIGIISASAQFDLLKLKSMCNLPQADYPNFKSDCLIQLAGSAMASIPEQKDRITQYCQSLDPAYQPGCLSQITRYDESNRQQVND